MRMILGNYGEHSCLREEAGHFYSPKGSASKSLSSRIQLSNFTVIIISSSKQVTCCPYLPGVRSNRVHHFLSGVTVGLLTSMAFPM